MIGQPTQGAKPISVFLNPTLLGHLKIVGRGVQPGGLRERKRFTVSGHAF
jgi:hypothetical protein